MPPSRAMLLATVWLTAVCGIPLAGVPGVHLARREEYRAVRVRRTKGTPRTSLPRFLVLRVRLIHRRWRWLICVVLVRSVLSLLVRLRRRNCRRCWSSVLAFYAIRHVAPPCGCQDGDDKGRPGLIVSDAELSGSRSVIRNVGEEGRGCRVFHHRVPGWMQPLRSARSSRSSGGDDVLLRQRPAADAYGGGSHLQYRRHNRQESRVEWLGEAHDNRYRHGGR
jgi:hypothetical protein